MTTYAHENDKTLRPATFYVRCVDGTRSIHEPHVSKVPFWTIDVRLTLLDAVILVTQDLAKVCGLTETEADKVGEIFRFAANRKASPDDPMTTPLVECVDDDEPAGMTDVEADADTLASAGYGTDEDYGSAEEVIP